MRILRQLLVAAAALALAVAVAPPAGAQISILGLKNSMVQFLLEQISVPGEFEVTAEAVEEPEDGVTSLVGVTVSDGQGVWLRVGEARLSWSPLRLLRGEIEIGQLGATDVELLRLPQAPTADAPETPDEPSGDPFAWPRAPLALQVRDVSLTRVTVAPGVIAEQGLAFDATGALADEGDVQSARLSLRRTDRVAGRIQLEYVRRFETPSLLVALTAQEAAGGLVAELGGLPATAASRVDLRAEGPFDAWRVRLNAEAERIVTVTGLLTLDAAERLSAVASLTATPGPDLDPAAAAALAPRARLAFRAAEGEGGLVRIEEGAFTSAGLSVEASGSWNRETTEAALDLTAAAGPELSALVDGTSWERIGFAGGVDGPLDALSAQGELTVQGLEAPSLRVGSAHLDATAVVAPGDISATLEGLLENVAADRLPPEALGPVRISADVSLVDQTASLRSLAIASDLLELTAEGTADLGAGAADLRYALSAPDLGPAARAYDVPVSAALSVEGRAEGPFARLRLIGAAVLEELNYAGRPFGRVALDHDVEVGEGAAGEATVTAEGEAYGRADIRAVFDARPDRVELSAFEADVLGAVLDGQAVVTLDVPEGRLPYVDGSFVIAAPDLTTLDPLLQPLLEQRLAGAIAGDVTLTAADGAQNAQALLTIERFSGFEATLERAEVDADVLDLLGAPNGAAAIEIRGLAHPSASLAEGRADVEATSVDGRTGVEAVFALTGIGAAGNLVIESFAGEVSAQDVLGVPDAVLEARLTGLASDAASLDEAELSFEGAALTSDAPNGRLSLVARGIGAGGATAPEASLQALITPEGRVEAQADVPRVSGDGVDVAAVRLNAEADDSFGDDPAIDVTVAVDRLRSGAVALRGVEATALGTLSALDLAARARGRLDVGEEPKPLLLAAEARMDLAGEGPQGEVSRFRVEAGEAVLRLREPLRISSEAGVTRLENIALRLPGGTLDASAALHPDGVVAEATADIGRFRELRSTAQAFDVAVPLASADIDFSLQADTRPASAGATAELQARDLRIVQPDDGVVSDAEALEPLALAAEAAWDGARASVDAALSGPFGEPVRVEAAVPLAAGEGGAPALQPNGPLSGAVTWQGDVAEFWSYVPAPDHVLSGRMDIDLSVRGTVAAPLIAGSVSMRDGQYQNLETGTILTAMTLSSALDDDGGLLLELTARDGADGALRAEVDFGAGELTARLTSDNATLVRRDDLTANISADITAQGPVTSPAITGEVRVDRAEFSLLASLPPSVADLGDVRFRDDPPPEPPSEAEGAAPLDIRVHAPGNMFVRGRGLDSEWQMELEIVGTLLAPRITGVIERVRGRLDFIGRNFELARGAIRFPGSRVIDPILDVSLEHERDGFTGRIEVSGVASDPEIAFTSNPPVPEGEVLPRTIFGEDSQSLGPGDAILLANGIAELTGRGGGGAVRNALGLDVLRIDEGSDGTAEVSVGKNVADGVFVGVNQPVDGSPSTVEVEVEVYPSVSVTAETGQEDGSTVGLNWRVDW